MKSLDTFYYQFVDIVEALVHSYGSLLALLIDERGFLISSSLVQLKKNNQKKENLLLQIHFLEERRNEKTKEFLKVLSIQKQSLSFSDLIFYFDEPQKKENLKKLFNRFYDLVEEVNEKNVYNKKIIKSALKHSKGALNEIRDFFYEARIYKREGKIKKDNFFSGRIISKEI